MGFIMVSKRRVAAGAALLITVAISSWTHAADQVSAQSTATAGAESDKSQENPGVNRVDQGTALDDATVSGARKVAADYLIGSGDVLDIAVWKDEALTRSLVVLPDGTINFPLIGTVAVAGKTVGQVRAELVRALERFVPELDLTVDVKQSNSMIVYVIGRVNAPGRQILNSNVDVLQALAMAGGLNPFAGRNSIKIFRKEGGATKVFAFRYGDVVAGDLATNIELQRGDVVVVP
jgi:polysaccharide biosynthesis/export protein